MADNNKVPINLTTGLEDGERITVSDFFANGRGKGSSWQDDGNVLHLREKLQRVARGVLADVC